MANQKLNFLILGLIFYVQPINAGYAKSLLTLALAGSMAYVKGMSINNSDDTLAFCTYHENLPPGDPNYNNPMLSALLLRSQGIYIDSSDCPSLLNATENGRTANFSTAQSLFADKRLTENSLLDGSDETSKNDKNVTQPIDVPMHDILVKLDLEMLDAYEAVRTVYHHGLKKIVLDGWGDVKKSPDKEEEIIKRNKLVIREINNLYKDVYSDIAADYDFERKLIEEYTEYTANDRTRKTYDSILDDLNNPKKEKSRYLYIPDYKKHIYEEYEENQKSPYEIFKNDWRPFVNTTDNAPGQQNIDASTRIKQEEMDAKIAAYTVYSDEYESAYKVFFKDRKKHPNDRVKKQEILEARKKVCGEIRDRYKAKLVDIKQSTQNKTEALGSTQNKTEALGVLKEQENRDRKDRQHMFVAYLALIGLSGEHIYRNYISPNENADSAIRQQETGIELLIRSAIEGLYNRITAQRTEPIPMGKEDFLLFFKTLNSVSNPKLEAICWQPFYENKEKKDNNDKTFFSYLSIKPEFQDRATALMADAKRVLDAVHIYQDRFDMQHMTDMHVDTAGISKENLFILSEYNQAMNQSNLFCAADKRMLTNIAALAMPDIASFADDEKLSALRGLEKKALNASSSQARSQDILRAVTLEISDFGGRAEPREDTSQLFYDDYI